MTVSAEAWAALLRDGPDPEHARIVLRWRPDGDSPVMSAGLAIKVYGVVGTIESTEDIPGGEVEAVVVIPRQAGA